MRTVGWINTDKRIEFNIIVYILHKFIKIIIFFLMLFVYCTLLIVNLSLYIYKHTVVKIDPAKGGFRINILTILNKNNLNKLCAKLLTNNTNRQSHCVIYLF